MRGRCEGQVLLFAFTQNNRPRHRGRVRIIQGVAATTATLFSNGRTQPGMLGITLLRRARL